MLMVQSVDHADAERPVAVAAVTRAPRSNDRHQSRSAGRRSISNDGKWPRPVMSLRRAKPQHASTQRCRPKPGSARATSPPRDRQPLPAAFPLQRFAPLKAAEHALALFGRDARAVVDAHV